MTNHNNFCNNQGENREESDRNTSVGQLLGFTSERRPLNPVERLGVTVGAVLGAAAVAIISCGVYANVTSDKTNTTNISCVDGAEICSAVREIGPLRFPVEIEK